MTAFAVCVLVYEFTTTMMKFTTAKRTDDKDDDDNNNSPNIKIENREFCLL